MDGQLVHKAKLRRGTPWEKRDRQRGSERNSLNEIQTEKVHQISDFFFSFVFCQSSRAAFSVCFPSLHTSSVADKCWSLSVVLVASVCCSSSASHRIEEGDDWQ